MKKIFFTLLVLILLISSCKDQQRDFSGVISRISVLMRSGELKKAVTLADSLKRITANEKTVHFADSVIDLAHRIPLDFSLTENEVMDKLRQNLGEKFDSGKIKEMEKKGWLEYRIIDGEKKYFNRAASNLILISRFRQNRADRDTAIARDPYMVFRRAHNSKIIAGDRKSPSPAQPVQMEVIYTITLAPDAVPDGETVRCWLPYPKENSPRQKDVYLLGVSNEDFILAPDSCVHRSVYMENKAEKGKPVVFRISYSYTSSGQYFNPDNLKPEPYDKSSALFKKYTAEQLPQICFTSKIKHIADSITGNETDPFRIVHSIYRWINNTVPWAGALEYSIMENIPEYVLNNHRGDCGMQTFLLMSMLRYKGIPVKWQSGWMMPPDNKNLHDWCEVYYEGIGWVPVDISFGLNFSADRYLDEFYISGIDSYRLIVNDGISGDFYPSKKFMRSEPFDFQRGELEWKGGNIYFDKWDYEMKITYR